MYLWKQIDLLNSPTLVGCSLQSSATLQEPEKWTDAKTAAGSWKEWALKERQGRLRVRRKRKGRWREERGWIDGGWVKVKEVSTCLELGAEGIYISFEWDDEQRKEAGRWDGRAAGALRWSCVRHKYLAVSDTSVQGDTLVCACFSTSFFLSSALTAFNCFAHVQAHGWGLSAH